MDSFNSNKPYNDLPLLPPKAEFETKKVLVKTISACRALAHLNGAIKSLPNPRLFIDTIQLQEARASSEIENIVMTNEDVFKAVIADKKQIDPATKEVINYKSALWLGLNRLETKPFITTNLCIELVQCIKNNSAGIRSLPGTNLSNSRGEVIYTPPVGENIIRDKLANLENFINREDTLDPLIKMALMHYQFEAIHPFYDGNGRTGRILLLLYLKKEKLLDVPAIFLSDYIIRHKSEYYRRLRDVTVNDNWEEFLIYMLDMVETKSLEDISKLNKVISLMDKTSERVKSTLPKVYSKELIEILFQLPYTKRQLLVDAGMGTVKTVGNYLISLEEHGFLKSIRVGKEKIYINLEFMNLLG